MSFLSFPVIVLLLLRRGTLAHIVDLFKTFNRGTISFDFVCKPTTVVRIRVRERIVRIRVSETAVGVRIVVRTTHSTVVELCPSAFCYCIVNYNLRVIYFYAIIFVYCVLKILTLL